MVEQELITANEKQRHNAADIQLAVATLMMEVVRADHHIDRLEVAEVIETLRNNFNLDGNAVGRLLELAGDVGNFVLRLETLTKRICELWNHDERLELLKKLWSIAAADQDIDVREVTLIEQVSLLLEIDENKSLEVRRLIEQRLRGSLALNCNSQPYCPFVLARTLANIVGTFTLTPPLTRASTKISPKRA